MTRAERLERTVTAYNEFVRIVEREKSAPMEQRLMLAMEAVLGLADIDVDQLREFRARRVIEAVAARHGVTVEQLTGGGKLQAFVRARDEARAELLALGWNTVQVARAVGCAAHEVMRGVRRHEARAAAAGARKAVSR